MEHGIKEKGERFKALAEIFLKNDERIFIKDSDNNYYFADILFVGEDTIEIQCFGPEDRKGFKFVLYYPMISILSKYEEIKR